MSALDAGRRRTGWFRGRVWLGASLATVVALFAGLVSAAVASATVGLSVHSFVAPTHFSASDEVTCTSPGRCDRYQVVIRNVGDTKTSGPIEVTDRLPAGITTTGKTSSTREVTKTSGWSCTSPSVATEKVNVVKCKDRFLIVPEQSTVALAIPTTAPSVATASVQHGVCLLKGEVRPLTECVEKNEVEVTGGGASGVATATNETVVSGESPSFELTDHGVETTNLGGGVDVLAGGHPFDVTANVGFSNIFAPEGIGSSNPTSQVQPVENPKDVVVELPAGFIGDPQALPTCPENDLTKIPLGSEEEKTACPPASRVGVLTLDAEGTLEEAASSGEESGPSSIYNMTPAAGYPAEFAFQFVEKTFYLYPTVVHTPSGYRLRVAAPNITEAVDLVGASLTFFGDPATLDNTSGQHKAFLTNPADCAKAASEEGLLKTKIEADSWETPGRWVTTESTTYPALTGCNLLQSGFTPTLEMAPSPPAEEGTSQADSPSAYDVDLKLPQKELFEESATPDLKDATVTLPEGVSVSPSAADGLAGCAEHGPNGIDIPESQSGHEAGEGEAIGPDGLPHMIPGHCPPASTLGTVEILTPLLAAPLTGHVYLAQPKCGGEGQPPCTEASATNGELYGLYIEAEDKAAGVIVKLPGSVSANPSTGQLTGTFKDNPQLPFSELKLHFHGGPRAPLANPQSCGTFTTRNALTSWSMEAGEPPLAGANAFAITGCSGGPFAPGFQAGTISSTAGSYSPFVLSFSRQDREQDLSGLSVTLPPGLLGKIAGVPLCGEEQANAGTCGPETLLGSASALAGPGAHPFSVTGGRVYLTTGYKGQPFGLSIVVPAVAGPFNLGNVVVRASIHIDPNTGQVTVTSDPLPQSRDGVPFRLRQVNTEIDRSGFTFNPTNCSALQVTGTITGSQGAKANVASPFAVTGCAGLPFKPSFTASTSGKTSKANGASLVVNVAQKPGEANIHKVALTLPLVLPVRLTTLQKACTEAQFNANPAGCPQASFIGTATANTSVLPVPLTGPAILVSHGGAAFPDVEFILQGDGVQIVLDGKTDIKKGITYSRFETVPDAPISSFVTTLPQGPHSALAANGNLCATTKTVTVKKRVTVRKHGHTKHVTKKVKQTVATPLQMPTTITGQNGAQITQNTKIAVTGCPKAKPTKAKKTVKGKKK